MNERRETLTYASAWVLAGVAMVVAGPDTPTGVLCAWGVVLGTYVALAVWHRCRHRRVDLRELLHGIGYDERKSDD